MNAIENRFLERASSGRRWQSALLLAALGCWLGSAGTRLLGEDAALPELRTAAEVRRLTAAQTTRHYPVRLRGVITFFDAIQSYHILQDQSAGIYFYFDRFIPSPPLAAGMEVEIEGESNPGEYAPIILPHQIRALGQGTYPEAKPVDYEQLASGRQDSQFVEVRGIVRAARFDEETRYYLVDIATGGGRLTVQTAKLPLARSEDLVDCSVRARGVCVSRFNRLRQLFDLRLLVPRAEDLMVEKAGPPNPFAMPVQPIGTLMHFAPEDSYGHRVKVSGTVICRQNGNSLYIEDENGGLYVETVQGDRLLPGQQVEVLGFPANGDYTPKLQDAVFRVTGSALPPAPDPVNTDEALKGTHDCRLVRIEATVVDRTWQSQEQFLVLEAQGFLFQAYMERPVHGSGFSYLRNGSEVSVTGVCLVEKVNKWFSGDAWRAKSFRILMRSASDIMVLQQPPWWTLQRMLWALAVLGLVVLAAFAWVAVLRRRVHKQTDIIRAQLQTEEALKDRYQALFENASDMVFTHDLSGRITSINKAGERLLQRPRSAIVEHKLTELVAAEERPKVEQWLNQAVQETELADAEWDFVNGAGQRLKLELNSRLVEQGPHSPEVEGIARDVTERKRLEKEILEASSREQRRIGHDLHDGVCQQLVAIAYLCDVLADQLGGEGNGAADQAEKISQLLQQTLAQTRSVARGLFPVRLEENGLVSALQEFAATASSLFRIQCGFDYDEALPALENVVALHLYYIVQEAVVNAAKHGQATRVKITLSCAKGRLNLSVVDDGIGFQPASVAGVGMGIRIMRYRARVIGATLDLKSKPGGGTQITCGVYLPPGEPFKDAKDEQKNL